jgi:hypothetical protein
MLPPRETPRTNGSKQSTASQPIQRTVDEDALLGALGEREKSAGIYTTDSDARVRRNREELIMAYEVLTERWGTQGYFPGESFEIIDEAYINNFVEKVNQEDPITYESMLSIARTIEEDFVEQVQEADAAPPRLPI